MWSKVLTVINTFLLVALIGVGAFGVQTYMVKEGVLKTQLEKFATDLKELDESQKEILDNPFLKFGGEDGETLKLGDNEISGYVDVNAFLIEEDVTVGTFTPKVAYLNFSNPSDPQIEEFVDDVLKDGASSQFGKDSEYYFMTLGCNTEGVISNTEFTLKGDTLVAFKKATESKPVKARVFLGPYPNVTGAAEDAVCNSFIKNVQIPSE